MILQSIGACFLIFWGIYALYTSFTNKDKLLFSFFPNIIPPKILGESYIPVMNFIFGLITLFFGIIVLYDLLTIIPGR